MKFISLKKIKKFILKIKIKIKNFFNLNFNKIKNFTFVLLLFICVFVFRVHDSRENETHRQSKGQDTCLSWLKGPMKQDDPTLLELLKTKFIDSPSTRPYSLSSDPTYNAAKESLSWPVIHKVLRKIFYNTTNRKGFFVEAGALDGEFLSNTLWLEKELGWSGLLIEPNSFSYKKLLGKNRKVWSSNTCLSAKPYPYQTVFVSVAEDKHDFKKFNSWIYKGASHVLGYTMPPKYDNVFDRSSNSYSTVQCFPLYSYLLALNRTEVDVLVLDIQGTEDEVIATIPFDKLRIKVFVVEHYGNGSFDPSFKAFFGNHGYQLLQCFGENDYIFVSKEEFEIPGRNVTSCKSYLS